MSNKALGSQPCIRGEIQRFGTLRQFPAGLTRDARLYSCERLNPDVIRPGEKEAWFLAEHLVETPSFEREAQSLLSDPAPCGQLEFLDRCSSLREIAGVTA